MASRNLTITQVATSSTPVVITSVEGNTGAIKAMPANSAAVYVGSDDDVDATSGWPLAAGEAIGFDTLNTNKVYVYSAAAQRVAVIVGSN